MHPFSIIKLDSVDSTNNWAKNAIVGGALRTDAVIVADTQINGRGQMQTMWHDEKGKNLLFTLVFTPKNLKATDFFQLNEAVSSALIDALVDNGFEKEAKIKWPNDILINRKKVAGMLIETSVSGNQITKAYIGIGLNVNQLKFDSSINATSLALEKEKSFERQVLLDNILSHLHKRLHVAKVPGNHHDYRKSLFGLGETLQYQDKNEIFLASIKEVKQSGELILQAEGEAGLRSYRFKEVKWVEAINE